MWILPKSLTCRFAPGTEALTSHCADASRACGQSLMLRSRPSRASSFLRGWKAGNLTRLRSGLISNHSLGESFADWWTSSLAATRASHSQPLESDSEAKTRDTSGRLSQAAFDFFNLESACLRTSRATLPKGCITSCLTWEDWVTEQRGEFSQRLNAARLISGSGSLSWPTATTTEAKSDTLQDRAARGKQVMLCHAVRQWPTPQTSDQHQAASSDRPEHRVQLKDVATGFGRPDRESRSTDGSRQELWATPRAGNPGSRKLGTGGAVLGEQVKNQWPTPVKTDGEIHQNLVRWRERQAIKAEKGINLQRPLMIAVAQEIEKQAQSWATPEAKNQVGYQVGADGTKWPRLGSQVKDQWATPKASDPQHSGPNMRDSSGNYALPAQAVRANQTGGKLNPRWVETLMGLPVGWTMPSCASPATIAPTSSDCSAMESCQQQPSSPSAP